MTAKIVMAPASDMLGDLAETFEQFRKQTVRVLGIPDSHFQSHYVHMPIEKYTASVNCDGPSCPMCKVSPPSVKPVMAAMTYRQVRFPRSKKKRIQKKWRKNFVRNWKWDGPGHMFLHTLQKGYRHETTTA